MRVLIIVFLFIGSNVLAQSNQKGTIKVKKDSVYTKPEKMPEFPGGANQMGYFIQRNLRYPQREKELKISGTCYVTFTVEIDSTISNIKILKGVPKGPGCDSVALRAVGLMPKWSPGRNKGTSVRVQYTLPINFIL